MLSLRSQLAWAAGPGELELESVSSQLMEVVRTERQILLPVIKLVIHHHGYPTNAISFLLSFYSRHLCVWPFFPLKSRFYYIHSILLYTQDCVLTVLLYKNGEDILGNIHLGAIRITEWSSAFWGFLVW